MANLKSAMKYARKRKRLKKKKSESQIPYHSTVLARRKKRRKGGRKEEMKRKQVTQRIVNLENPSCRLVNPIKYCSVSLAVSWQFDKGLHVTWLDNYMESLFCTIIFLEEKKKHRKPLQNEIDIKTSTG